MASRTFEHYMIVRQEHLNQYGNLFGGRVLSVIDELAFIACSLTHPGHNFVTRSVRNAEFMAPAHLGDILEFTFGVGRVGTTSVTVDVTMNVRRAGKPPRALSFDGQVVMVCVNEDGTPVPVAQDDCSTSAVRQGR